MCQVDNDANALLFQMMKHRAAVFCSVVKSLLINNCKTCGVIKSRDGRCNFLALRNKSSKFDFQVEATNLREYFSSDAESDILCQLLWKSYDWLLNSYETRDSVISYKNKSNSRLTFLFAASPLQIRVCFQSSLFSISVINESEMSFIMDLLQGSSDYCQKTAFQSINASCKCKISSKMSGLVDTSKYNSSPTLYPYIPCVPVSSWCMFFTVLMSAFFSISVSVLLQFAMPCFLAILVMYFLWRMPLSLFICQTPPPIINFSF